MALLEMIFSYLLPLILLVITYFTNKYYEKKHYESILEREEALRHIRVVPIKKPPRNFTRQQLVRGSVVITSSHFTRFLAAFRHFFGGHIGSYEVLLDRARREAILRMKEEADELGANIVFNMKFETATLGNIHAPQSGMMGTVEVLVYGTAGVIEKRN